MQQQQEPKAWGEFYAAAQQVGQIEHILAQTPRGAGIVAQALRPSLKELKISLVCLAAQRFNALGRLALARSSLEECVSLLPSSNSVLLFALHAHVLHQLEAVQGAPTTERFVDNCEWPLALPAEWLSAKHIEYKTANNVILRLACEFAEQNAKVSITCVSSSSGRQEETFTLRVGDYVSSLDGQPPALVSAARNKDLQSLVARTVDTVRNPPPPSSKMAASDLFQKPSASQPQMRVAGVEQAGLFSLPPSSSLREPSSSAQRERDLFQRPHGFEGDLTPGQGGSMLFGPGNPDFNNMQPPLPPSQQQEPPHLGVLPSGHVPGARFDPYGPSATMGGDPDWDDVPMPGPPRPPPQPKPPGKLGGWGNNFL